jgi:hypothetical protein
LPDGRTKQILEIGRQKNKRKIGMQGTVQDVTNGNRVEENLISANRLLDESQQLLSWEVGNTI